MQYLSNQTGQTVSLSHPFAGPQPLPLHHRLRALKLTDAERKLVANVSARVGKLHDQAAAYGAPRLLAELEAAKAKIALDITEEFLEEIARLTALAADPAVARRVAEEANSAVAPAIAAADAELIPICDRLIAEVRTELEASAARFDLEPLLEFIGASELGQVGQYVRERIAATHTLLDAWKLKARNNGALAFIRDDCQFS